MAITFAALENTHPALDYEKQGKPGFQQANDTPTGSVRSTKITFRLNLGAEVIRVTKCRREIVREYTDSGCGIPLLCRILADGLSDRGLYTH